MICPLKPQAYDPNGECYPDIRCDGKGCAWWDSSANYNYETKTYTGQCCILTLAKLKVSGKVNSHAY